MIPCPPGNRGNSFFIFTDTFSFLALWSKAIFLREPAISILTKRGHIWCACVFLCVHTEGENAEGDCVVINIPDQNR